MRSTLRRKATVSDREQWAAITANRSLCRVLRGFADKGEYDAPIVEAFGNRYVLSGDLFHGQLWLMDMSRWPLAIRDGEVCQVLKRSDRWIELPIWKPLGSAI